MTEWKINNYFNYKDCNLSKTEFTMVVLIDLNLS